MTATENRRLNVCLFGCGSMGRFHGKSILRHPTVSSLSLCDLDSSRARMVADELGARWLPLDEALSVGGFDACFIATPASEHVDQLLRIVPTGAHVFCEKPLGDNLRSIDDAMSTLESHSGRIQVGFNRRFDPHMAEMKRRIQSGDIGEIEQLRIVSRDHVAPSVESLGNSAGLLFETTVHDFDLTRWMLDDEICEVMCLGDALINPSYANAGHIDTATTVMRGMRGQQVVIQNSWRTSYGYDQRVEAFGAGGRLTVVNPAERSMFREDASGLHRGVIPSDWFARYPEAYCMEVAAFLDTITSGGAVKPNLIDGYMASYLAQQASVSQQTGLPVCCETRYGTVS